MQRPVARGVVLIVTVLCITGMALPAAAIGGAPTADTTHDSATTISSSMNATQAQPASTASNTASDNARITEHAYVNLATDQVYQFGPDPDTSSLPDGTYLEVRTIETGNETREETRQVQISSGQVSALATTSDYQLTLQHDHSNYHASYEAGSTVDLYISAANDTGPVSNVDLTVTIRAPDGTEETRTATIGEDGSTVLSYDTTGLSSGQYDVIVESSDGPSEYGEFIIGQQIKDIFPGIGTTTTVGSEVNAAVLLTENASPVTNTQTEVTLERPDGTEETRSVTINEDGFGQLSFTPTQPGQYLIDADNFHEYFSIDVGTYAADVRVNGEEYGSEARPGSTISFSGQLRNDAGAASQVPLSVQVVRNPYDEEKAVANLSTSTDATGTFYTEWTVPSDVPDGTEYEFRYTADTDAQIAGYTPDLIVRDAGSEPGVTSVLDVSVDHDKEFALPGDTVALSVEATVFGENQAPSAYANQELTLLPSIDYDHPIDELTVQTDASGEATVTYTVPDLPDGADLSFGATADFNGTISAGGGDLSVQRYALEDDWEGPSAPGGTATYQFSVTDVASGDPVADFPLMLAAERSERRASVYATETLRTNSSGAASTAVTVPDDASGRNHFGTFARYEQSNSFPAIEVPGFDAQLTGLDSYEYAAGETLTMTYDGPAGSTAVIGVRTYSATAPSPLATTQIEAGEQFTITIPADTPQGTYYNIQGFAAATNGETTRIWDSFRVEGSTGNLPPTAAFTYSPTEPTTDDTVTFDAGSSSDDDGSISTYQWDFNADGTVDATGETASYQYDSAGTYSASLTVTDDSGATDTVTKTVTVSATSSGGATAALEPANLSVSTSGTSTVDIVVENTGDVAVYNFDVALTNASPAQISDISLNGEPSTQNVTIASDGSSATVDAALASVDATDGATLATVELTGVQTGESTLETTVNTLGDAEGVEYNISEATATTAVTVQAGPGDVTGNGNAATDPDGDGTYEDINGDGSANLLDVQSLFGNLDSESVSGNTAFDINGDGSVNILDVQALFASV